MTNKRTFPDKNKATYVALIMRGIPHRSALVYVDILDELKERGSLSQREIAALTKITPPSVRPHLQLLEERHVLVRDHYRSWSIGPWLSEISKEEISKAKKPR